VGGFGGSGTDGGPLGCYFGLLGDTDADGVGTLLLVHVLEVLRTHEKGPLGEYEPLENAPNHRPQRRRGPGKQRLLCKHYHVFQFNVGLAAGVEDCQERGSGGVRGASGRREATGSSLVQRVHPHS